MPGVQRHFQMFLVVKHALQFIELVICLFEFAALLAQLSYLGLILSRWLLHSLLILLLYDVIVLLDQVSQFESPELVHLQQGLDGLILLPRRRISGHGSLSICKA